RDLGEGWGEEEAERRGFTSAVETFSTFSTFPFFAVFTAFAAFAVFPVCAGVCPAAGEAVLRDDAGVMRRSWGRGDGSVLCSLSGMEAVLHRRARGEGESRSPCSVRSA